MRRLHYPHLGITKTQLTPKISCRLLAADEFSITDVITKCETCVVNAGVNQKELSLMPHKVPKLP